MAMFHSPLGLAKHVSHPETRLDALPLLTVLLLALMLSFAGSRFLFSPGLTITLPQSETGRLPGIATGSTMTVLSTTSSGNIVFDGHIYSLDDNLQKSLSVAAKRRPVLLLKADKSIPAQTLFTIYEYATKAGFEKVQIAGESAPPK